MAYIATLYELIDDLEGRTQAFGSFNFKSRFSDGPLQEEKLTFANQEREKHLVTFTIDNLLKQKILDFEETQTIARRLFDGGNFYGDFAEIATYGWLMRRELRFEIPARLDGSAVLNPNGSALDGLFHHPPAYFDIKVFGLGHYVADKLERILMKRNRGMRVHVEGPMDVDVKLIESEAMAKIKDIETALKAGHDFKISSLGWTVKAIWDRKPVIQRIRSSHPYKQAKELKYYPLNHASQFTRNNPFILIYSYLPRFNPFLQHDEVGHTQAFLRSLARRVFIELSGDTKPLSKFDSSVYTAPPKFGQVAKIRKRPEDEQQESGRPTPATA